ncbi:MAG TPA: alkaline phosphatase family protein [Gemmatimonadales bacterium]|nr:alkaline phosphatase family protein [Gemmatimonadales bacterium]
MTPQRRRARPTKRPRAKPAASGSPQPAAPGGRPIAHVVLLIKENHSFDNYFGTFPGANGATVPHSPNPPPRDPNHGHAAWLTRDRTAVRAQFVEADIPAYFAYARQFTLCDNYYTDVAGPSTPNHLMLIAAASPVIDNPPRAAATRFPLASLPAALERAQRTWRNYGGYAFDLIQELAGRPTTPSDQFATDAAAGNLPAVSWVYAPHDASEHPPDATDAGHPLVGNVTHGMQWTVAQVNAIVQGGLWPSTAIFITWDDWGGWYDHVTPPNVEAWRDGTQFRYGSRVGCLVLGGYARRGYLSRVLHSHVSLVRFCETTFGVPALGPTDRAADDLSDCFDFTQPPGPPPH